LTGNSDNIQIKGILVGVEEDGVMNVYVPLVFFDNIVAALEGLFKDPAPVCSEGNCLPYKHSLLQCEVVQILRGETYLLPSADIVAYMQEHHPDLTIPEHESRIPSISLAQLHALSQHEDFSNKLRPLLLAMVKSAATEFKISLENSTENMMHFQRTGHVEISGSGGQGNLTIVFMDTGTDLFFPTYVLDRIWHLLKLPMDGTPSLQEIDEPVRKLLMLEPGAIPTPLRIYSLELAKFEVHGVDLRAITDYVAEKGLTDIPPLTNPVAVTALSHLRQVTQSPRHPKPLQQVLEQLCNILESLPGSGSGMAILTKGNTLNLVS